MTTSISYSISIPDPASHWAEVELRLVDADALPEELQFHMAAWCPGSYLIRDYARHVSDIEVQGDDCPLPIAKVDKQVWQVERRGCRRLRVRYRLYCRELTVRTNHVDATHALLNGPATFLYLAELRHAPCGVSLSLPDELHWSIATALPFSNGEYRARDLDHLFDSPIHAGRFQRSEFVAAGVPFELVLWGEAVAGERTVEDLCRDLARVVAVHAARIGGELPFPRYQFHLLLAPGLYGGLEHSDCSTNLAAPTAMVGEKEYGDLLELLSHEFFHAWNGKRMFPRAFKQLDYGRENYTHCLWVVEGMTAYIDRHTLRAASCMSVGRYLEKVLEEWALLQGIPGRRRYSLEEASFDAWIKLYKPDESTINTSVSYYLKGGLVHLCLDLEIRKQTAGERSLADVFRHLWARYGRTGAGYPEELLPDFEQASGASLSDFFARFVSGREDPDLPAYLANAGVMVQPLWDRPEKYAHSSPGYLGAILESGSTRLASVLEGGPGQRGGLSPADELIACDGYRLEGEADLRRRIASRAPGTRVELALFRLGRLHQSSVELAESPPTRYAAVVEESASAAERACFRAWLGEEFPAPGVLATGNVARWI
jgi:predicted metalloprotease with PDZ domain